MSERLAYLAGFFDGEGSIGFWKSGRTEAHRYFRLSLANSNHDILLMFQAEFGGTINDKPYTPKPGRVVQNRQMWTWRCASEEAWAAYYKMRPWLREKLWRAEPMK